MLGYLALVKYTKSHLIIGYELEEVIVIKMIRRNNTKEVKLSIGF